MAGSWLSLLRFAGRLCWATKRLTSLAKTSGLTARNQPHGEVTAIVQAPDRSRGDVQTPRDPGQRNPQASSLELHETPQKNCHIRLAYAMFRADRSQNEVLQLPSWRGHGSASQVGRVKTSNKISLMIIRCKVLEWLTENRLYALCSNELASSNWWRDSGRQRGRLLEVRGLT